MLHFALFLAANLFLPYSNVVNYKHFENLAIFRQIWLRLINYCEKEQELQKCKFFFAIMLAFFPLKLAWFINIPYYLFLYIVLAIFIFSCFTLYLQCIRHVCSTGNRSCDMLNWNIYSACKQLLSCAQSFPSLHPRQIIRKSRLQFVLLLHFRCGTSFSALSICNQLLLSLLLLLCTSLTFSFLQWQIEKAIQTNPIAKPPEKER